MEALTVVVNKGAKWFAYNDDTKRGHWKMVGAYKVGDDGISVRRGPDGPINYIEKPDKVGVVKDGKITWLIE